MSRKRTRTKQKAANPKAGSSGVPTEELLAEGSGPTSTEGIAVAGDQAAVMVEVIVREVESLDAEATIDAAALTAGADDDIDAAALTAADSQRLEAAEPEAAAGPDAEPMDDHDAGVLDQGALLAGLAGSDEPAYQDPSPLTAAEVLLEATGGTADGSDAADEQVDAGASDGSDVADETVEADAAEADAPADASHDPSAEEGVALAPAGDASPEFVAGASEDSGTDAAADDDAGELAVLPTSAASMEPQQFKQLIEALVFASDKPMTIQRLRQLTRVSDVRRIETALGEIATDYEERGLVLQQVSGGYQFRTRSQFSVWVQQLIAGRPVRLSRAQLETLAIIAYRQPITRPEIDDIRGVDSSATLKLLMDRALIRILGKREEVGRPMLYGTTKEFLDFFSLGDLRELPTLREFSELSEESRQVMSSRLGIEPDGTPAGAGLASAGLGGDGDDGDDGSGNGNGNGSDGGNDGTGGAMGGDGGAPEPDGDAGGTSADAASARAEAALTAAEGQAHDAVAMDVHADSDAIVAGALEAAHPDDSGSVEPAELEAADADVHAQAAEPTDPAVAGHADEGELAPEEYAGFAEAVAYGAALDEASTEAHDPEAHDPEAHDPEAHDPEAHDPELHTAPEEESASTEPRESSDELTAGANDPDGAFALAEHSASDGAEGGASDRASGAIDHELVGLAVGSEGVMVMVGMDEPAGMGQDALDHVEPSALEPVIDPEARAHGDDAHEL